MQLGEATGASSLLGNVLRQVVRSLLSIARGLPQPLLAPFSKIYLHAAIWQ